MKIKFPLPHDNLYHQFCPGCHSENIHRVLKGNRTFYFCDNCQKTYPKMIVIDPAIVWWLDEKTKEYWHESIGVFIFNKDNKALFFERIIYPFAFTIPSGHLDINELPEEAIKRELKEETGIEACQIRLFSQENVLGDKCRRGADNHRWSLFVAKVDESCQIKLNDEGVKPVWLSLEDALEKKLTFPVRYFIEKYKEKLFF